MAPFFSVVIPHYNGREHLDVCLSSLRRQSERDFEVLLVDNCSDDGSQEYVRQCFPEVRLIELNGNRGFTGACNAGFDAAGGMIIVLLNNDTEVDPGWLAALGAAFRRHPEVGIVASKLLLFDRRDTLHAAGDTYSVSGLPGNRGVWQRDTGQYERQEYVFGACAGAAAYRREMVAEIGFLDDLFYFSCEDVDISWRAQLAGWRVLFEPEAVVYHKLKATGGSSLSSFYDGRNFLYLIWKNYPASLLRRHWRDIVAAQLRIAAEALRAWRGQAARARLRGQVIGLFGLFGMRGRRRQVQSLRTVDDEALLSILQPVDEYYGER